MLTHTRVVFVGWAFHEVPAAEIDQFDLQGLCVDQEVLHFDVSVKYTPGTAQGSSGNHLPHEVTGQFLDELASVKLPKAVHVHAGYGAF